MRVGSIYLLKLAKQVGRNQALAKEMWQQSKILGARSLATRICEPKLMSASDLDMWLKDIHDWGTCDGFCAHVVRETPFAVDKVFEWVAREGEFERRAAFLTIAQLAWKKSDISDKVFASFLPLIEQYADDERYFVKKAVNWALRDIAKRNDVLKKKALKVIGKLQGSDNKTVRWVGTHRVKIHLN